MKFFSFFLIALFFANAVFAQTPDVRGDVEELNSGSTTFTLALYNSAKPKEGNFLIAPASVIPALGMTYFGAVGNTREEMARVLRFKMSKERLGKAFGSILATLSQESKGDTGIKLHILNGVWAEKTHPILPTYIAQIAQSFGAEIKQVDFLTASETARLEMNGWVSEKTEKRIENLIPQGGVTSDTRLTLISAEYLKAGWADKFELGETKAATFTCESGTKKEVLFMHKIGHSFGYQERGGFQILELPYKGKTTSMVIFLPRTQNGLAKVESEMRPSEMKEILNRFRMYKLERTPVVEVFLPKFKFTSEIELSETLSGLGMKDAFTQKANFSGIDGTRKLFISNVFHKTLIAVDEEGTEAAGATAVVLIEKGMPSPPIMFRADHPFMFLIYHKPTGTVLFMGRFANPD